MTWFEAALLGIVQGIAEFLPISSSGHLVILQSWFGLAEGALTFNVAVHLGSVLAVVAALRHEWSLIVKGVLGRAGARSGEGRRLLALLVAATIPAAIVGFALRDRIESAFSSPVVPGIMLLVTGALLWFADRGAGDVGRPLGSLRLRDVLWMGIGQACALLPGLSRSGSTISFGLLAGVDRATATRFSFLMAVPAILGAALVEGVELARRGGAGVDFGILAVGLISAAITSYAAIRFFLAFIRRGRLRWFSWYVWLVGIVVIALALSER